MSLAGPLLERTQTAVLAAFDYSELRQFVHIQLGQNFEVITLAPDLGTRVFELLLWAGRHNREQELLDKLAAARPANAEIALLAAALRSGEPLPTPRRTGPVPLQKPPRAAHFTGREGELARLLADLQPGRVLTLSGPGGVGKSALGAEAVWRLAPGDAPPARFPDGIIFHSFNGQPQAALALEAIARACGLDPRPTPRDAARQALAGKAALLLLESAEEADDLGAVLQVAGSCGVLVTTRRHWATGAAVQEVGKLPPSSGLALLHAWAGRYADNDQAAQELVRLLDGLPLALILVGSYLAGSRQPAGEYAQWLHEAGLAALHFGGQPHESVPLLLRHSLEQVSTGAQQAFGVAGVLAFAPFSAEPVAAALELSLPAARRLLAELVDYGLLLRPDDHYQVTHTLAHSFARMEAAPAVEGIGRLAVYYAAVAEAESKRGLAGYAILDRERAHLVAVQAAALAAEQWNTVRRTTWAVEDYLDLKGYWTERIIVVQAGLDAARATGVQYDEAEFANRLGHVYRDLGEPRRAIELYDQKLAISRQIGNRRGEAVALGSLGVVYADLGEIHHAIELYEQTLAIAREIGHRAGEGNALGNLGWTYATLGQTSRAIELYEQELVIVREIADRSEEGTALGNLGRAYADAGAAERAMYCCREALRIKQEMGDQRGEGEALSYLGYAHHAAGNFVQALELHRQGIAILEAAGAPTPLSLALIDLAETQLALVHYDEAAAAAEEAAQIAAARGYRLRHAAALWAGARAEYSRADRNRASVKAAAALEIYAALDHPQAAAIRTQIDGWEAA